MREQIKIDEYINEKDLYINEKAKILYMSGKSFKNIQIKF